MMIYFALSINVMLVLFTFKIKMVMRALISLIFCFIYACTDEFHQIFVSGRSPQMFDVMIDTSGALFGIMIALIIYCIIFTLYYTYQFKKQKENYISTNLTGYPGFYFTHIFLYTLFWLDVYIFG